MGIGKMQALKAFCCIIALGGCGNLTPYPHQNAFGARELIESESFEQINLPKLLSESGTPAPAKAVPITPSGSEMLGDQTGPTIDEAFRSFNSNKSDYRLRRNVVQERILAASVQRCSAYLRFLKQFDTEVSFGLGALATALGGVGAIVTPANAARALAGSAGITSGVKAEFQEQFFSKLAMQVIAKGIESRRAALYKEIRERQNEEDQAKYPVEAAVKDALFYHSACSLLTGLEEAGASIERANNPGIAQLNELFQKNEMFRDLFMEKFK